MAKLKSVCAYGQPIKEVRDVGKRYRHFPKKSCRGGKVRPPLMRYLLVPSCTGELTI